MPTYATVRVVLGVCFCLLLYINRQRIFMSLLESFTKKIIAHDRSYVFSSLQSIYFFYQTNYLKKCS